MDAACSLSCRVQAVDNLVACAQTLRCIVDLHAAHAIVDHRSHDCHVESIAGLQGQVMEELLAPLVPGLASAVCLIGTILGVLLLLLRELVVILEGRLDVGERNVVLLCELTHVVVGLHDAAPLVVLAMPKYFSGGLAIEAKEEASGVTERDALVLPHHASHIVSATELVAEAMALNIQQYTTDATERLGRQELHLGIWILGVDQACRMHLHPLEVNTLAADRHCHLQTIAGTMVAIGGWQMGQIRTMLVEQRV